MGYSGLEIVKADYTLAPSEFKCQKPEFAEYLSIDSIYDRQEKMGRMYWAIHNGKIVGYMMLAMGHVVKERQADLGIDTYGHVPALVIARLATDERHERQGVGKHMISYAISLAGKMALDVGCRVVLANSDPDAVGFYERMGFMRLPASPPPSGSGDPCSDAHAQQNTRDGENGLVPMYVDMGRDPSVYHL